MNWKEACISLRGVASVLNFVSAGQGGLGPLISPELQFPFLGVRITLSQAAAWGCRKNPAATI